MKRRYFPLMSAILLALAVAAFADDVWKDKPYESWDTKECQKVLNDSPWAQTLEIATSGGSGGDSMSGGSMREMRRPGGDSSANEGSSTDGGRQLFIARWLSSRTIREALARQQELNGKSPEESTKPLAPAPDNFQIWVQSQDMRAFQAADQDSLRNTVYLETKKTHQKIQPAKITLIKDAEGKGVAGMVAEFPKKSANGEATIASDEKGVDFIADAGKQKLKFHFDVSKMTDKQGIDL